MDESDIYKSRVDSLARIFSLDDASEEWSVAEMSQMLRDQMEEPLEAAGQTGTLRGLLEEAKPAESLLQEAKRANKPRPGASEQDAVREIQKVLYYTAIVAARLKLDARITELSDAALLKGVRWALELPWVDGSVRTLLESGTERLAGGAGNT